MNIRQQITNCLRNTRIFESLQQKGINITTRRDATGRIVTEVTGATFPVRKALAAMGGRWNAQAKVWEFPLFHGNDWGTLVRAVNVAN